MGGTQPASGEEDAFRELIHAVRAHQETLLHRATRNRFQPIVNLADSRCVGYEAIHRSSRPDESDSAQRLLAATDCRLTERMSYLHRMVAAEHIATSPRCDDAVRQSPAGRSRGRCDSRFAPPPGAARGRQADRGRDSRQRRGRYSVLPRLPPQAPRPGRGRGLRRFCRLAAPDQGPARVCPRLSEAGPRAGPRRRSEHAAAAADSGPGRSGPRDRRATDRRRRAHRERSPDVRLARLQAWPRATISARPKRSIGRSRGSRRGNRVQGSRFKVQGRHAVDFGLGTLDFGLGFATLRP